MAVQTRLWALGWMLALLPLTFNLRWHLGFCAHLHYILKLKTVGPVSFLYIIGQPLVILKRMTEDRRLKWIPSWTVWQYFKVELNVIRLCRQIPTNEPKRKLTLANHYLSYPICPSWGNALALNAEMRLAFSVYVSLGVCLVDQTSLWDSKTSVVSLELDKGLSSEFGVAQVL